MEGNKHPEMTALNVSQALQQERLALNTYQPYLGLRLEVLRVNSQSLVRIDNHQYSVPVACVGKAMVILPYLMVDYHSQNEHHAWG